MTGSRGVARERVGAADVEGILYGRSAEVVTRIHQGAFVLVLGLVA